MIIDVESRKYGGKAMAYLKVLSWKCVLKEEGNYDKMKVYLREIGSEDRT
jgi:hypothetical protein